MLQNYMYEILYVINTSWNDIPELEYVGNILHNDIPDLPRAMNTS
jgi:hypothetical protein